MLSPALRSVLAAALAGGLLAGAPGCATAPTPYQKVGGVQGALVGGLRERKISEGVYRIRLSGVNVKDPNERLGKIVALFAAELAVQDGYTHFVLLPYEGEEKDPEQLRSLRKRVAAGELNDRIVFGQIPIRVTRHRGCIHPSCVVSKAITVVAVMLRKEERPHAKTYDAKKVIAKFKPELTPAAQAG